MGKAAASRKLTGVAAAAESADSIANEPVSHDLAVVAPRWHVVPLTSQSGPAKDSGSRARWLRGNGDKVFGDISSHELPAGFSATSFGSQYVFERFRPDNGSYCPPQDQPPCSSNHTACADCKVCKQQLPADGRPELTDFQGYLPWFLEALPSEACAKGGAGAYSSAIQLDSTDRTGDTSACEGGFSSGVFWQLFYNILLMHLQCAILP